MSKDHFIKLLSDYPANETIEIMRVLADRLSHRHQPNSVKLAANKSSTLPSNYYRY